MKLNHATKKHKEHKTAPFILCFLCYANVRWAISVSSVPDIPEFPQILRKTCRTILGGEQFQDYLHSRPHIYLRALLLSACPAQAIQSCVRTISARGALVPRPSPLKDLDGKVRRPTRRRSSIASPAFSGRMTHCERLLKEFSEKVTVG